MTNSYVNKTKIELVTKVTAGAFADFELQTNMEAAYATLSGGLF